MSEAAVLRLDEERSRRSVAEVGVGADALGLPSPYLLFLGDTREPAYAKTAFGLRDWAADRCVGEWSVGEGGVSTGLPRLTPAEAHAARPRPGGHRRRTKRQAAADRGDRLRAGQEVHRAGAARAFAARGVDADFRATGQTGIMIAGSGIPMDAIVSDFESGAAEMLSPDAAPDHWDVIEGQGTLFHPRFAAVSLGLLHGSQPDVFVVCHDPSRTHVLWLPDMAPPSIEEVVEMTTLLGRRTDWAIRCGGVALNTSALDEADAAALIARETDRLGMPAADPVRGGPAFDALVDGCLA